MPDFEIKDSGKRYQNENGGVRDTSEGKINFTLIPYEEIKRLAYHYSVGLKKYGNKKEVEEWRPSGLRNDIEVSSFGNVRYLKDMKTIPMWYNRFGYKLITTKKTEDYDKKHYQVHRLVAEAFFGNCKLIVNHKDGIKDNNHIDNLEYCTQSENAKHAVFMNGPKNEGSGKITFEIAEQIREMVNSGEKQKDVAAHFGISCQYVNGIMKKRQFSKPFEKKYNIEKFNWKKLNTPDDLERFKESAFRHFLSWLNGEKDEDHAMACVFNIFAYEWHTFNNEEKRKEYVQKTLSNQPTITKDKRIKDVMSNTENKIVNYVVTKTKFEKEIEGE